MADDSISQFRRAAAAPPAKPPGGARLLSFLLQALVMAVALSLFFLFAGVAALVLLHLLVAGRAFRRRRQLAFYNPLADHTVAGLCATDLSKLPCFDYYAGCEVTECAVCLEGLKMGERCRALPGCGHVFHEVCVDRWLVLTPACPVCRGGVPRTLKSRWL